MEAEYIAACKGAKDAACLRELFMELNLPQDLTPTLHTDSEGGLKLTKTSKFQQRT